MTMPALTKEHKAKLITLHRARGQGLVLTRDVFGDGKWRLHPPGTTDDQIMTGDVMPLWTGDNPAGPTDVDYADAWRMLNPFEIGHRVTAGDPATEDFDSGRVVDVFSGLVTVVWSTGVRTTKYFTLLDRA